MGAAIGHVLAPAVGVAISPLPIVAIVLMLGTPRGRSNGLSFLVGWIFGLVLAGTIVLLVSGGIGASAHGKPAIWVSVLDMILGVALVLVAGRDWHKRRHGTDEHPLPKWMQAVDSFTPVRAGALGVALSGVNPKNLVLAISAAAAIAQTGTSVGEQAVAYGIFVLIGTLGTGTPAALYFALGERSEHILDDLKRWMARNNTAIMAVICLVIGAKLIGDGVSGLFA